MPTQIFTLIIIVRQHKDQGGATYVQSSTPLKQEEGKTKKEKKRK